MKSVQGPCHDVSMDQPVALSDDVPRGHPSLQAQQDGQPTSNVASQLVEHPNATPSQGMSNVDDGLCIDPTAFSNLQTNRYSIDMAGWSNTIAKALHLSPMDDFTLSSRANSAPCYLRVDPPPRVKSNENIVEGRLRRSRQFLAWLGRKYRYQEQVADVLQLQQDLLSEGIIVMDFAVTRRSSRSGSSTLRVVTTEAEQQQLQFISSADTAVVEGSPQAPIRQIKDDSAG